MKNLKLLNRISILFIFIFLFLFLFQYHSKIFATEPVDIWNLEKSSSENLDQEIDTEIFDDETKTLLKVLSNKNNENEIVENKNLDSNNISLVGLYDPEENGLSIDMWSNSNGDKIKDIFIKNRASKINTYIPANFC